MMRNYNHRLIRSKRCYSFGEVAMIYGIAVCTVRRWRRKGLKVIDNNNKPYLIYGKELIRFLKTTKEKRRIKLKPGQFNCLRCRTTRRSKHNEITIVFRKTKFTKGNRQVDIRGICEKCNCKLSLFSSEKRLKEMIEKGQVILSPGQRLIWSEGHPLYAQFKE
ncbi:MAG: hypothetical protein KAS53_03635 [Candidatus Cloacimonetes bacterium]|nr:hypothetical protein [Candidatus Cloacimonadota bacterium]